MPSYKATRDRRHSPKGRASLTREWLRQLAALGFDPAAEAALLRRQQGWRTFRQRLQNTRAGRRGEPDFSHLVKDAMDGCLACKSCTGQCPIKVDVPTFRAKFLELYYSRYLRPRRDYLVGSLETILPVVGKARTAYNLWIGSPPGRAAMRVLGLVHTPKFSPLDMRRELAQRDIGDATPEALSALSPEERARSVVLVQDAFTSVQRLAVGPERGHERPKADCLHQVQHRQHDVGLIPAAKARGIRALRVAARVKAPRKPCTRRGMALQS